MTELEVNLVLYMCALTIVAADGKVTPAERTFLDQQIRPLAMLEAVLTAVSAIPESDFSMELDRLLEKARGLGARTKTFMVKRMIKAAKADRRITQEEIDCIRKFSASMGATHQAERELAEVVPRQEDRRPSQVDDQRVANRAFWQRFIDDVGFDDPQQPKPRHGGNNWVRTDMPIPGTWLTIYRFEGTGSLEIGLFLRLSGEKLRPIYQRLLGEEAQLRQELGDLDLKLVTHKDGDAVVSVTHNVDVASPDSQDEQLVWLRRAANAMVGALRPRLAHFAGS